MTELRDELAGEPGPSGAPGPSGEPGLTGEPGPSVAPGSTAEATVKAEPSGRPSAWAIIRASVVLSLVTAALAGFGEGVVAAAKGGTSVLAAALGIALCGALLAVVAPVLGLVQGVAAWLVGNAVRRLGLTDWLFRHTTADRAAPRGPVIGFQAALLVVLPTTAALLVGLWVVQKAVATVQDPDLRAWLIVVAVAMLLAGGTLAGALVGRILLRPLGWIDRRWGLPWPRQAVARYLLFVLLPVVALLVPLILRHGAVLGRITLYLWLLLFLLAEGLLWLLWSWLGARRLRRPRRIRRVLVGLWALAIVGAGAAFELAPFSAGISVSRTMVARQSLDLLRHGTDVDRDGASSLFGGGDCGPFDGAVSPAARDVPGNGVDENCDGRDSDRGAGKQIDIGPWRSDQALLASKLKPRKYNIVWVISEATRADRCSVTGYRKRTTPYLEGIAKESLVFTRAYANAPATMLSFPSQFTGLRPGSITWKLGPKKSTKPRLQLTEKHLTIAERLREVGYRTGIVTGRYSKRVLYGMMQGFDKIADTWLDGRRMPWYARNAAVAATLALSFIEQGLLVAHSKKPFFLVVYTADGHDPYLRHKEGFPNFGRSASDRYDGEIAFTDRYMGMLIDYLRYRRPLWDNTVFIFTGDHGEEFGEHGGHKHAKTCYWESLRVPLVVRIPGLVGKRIDRRVPLIDIVPTLLDLLAVDPGGMTLDGQSLLIPAFAPEEASKERPVTCSVTSQKPADGRFMRRAIRLGDRLLIHNMLEGRYEFYDTKSDPRELNDIVGAHWQSAEVSELRELLAASLTGNLTTLEIPY